MSRIGDWMQEPAREVRVAAQADVVVVGGGPAGLAAAIAAARNGAQVTLLERYNHLGGLASGGMVLVLDDMWDSHLRRDLGARHLHGDDRAHGGAGAGRRFRARTNGAAAPSFDRRWARWGTFDFHSQGEAASDLLRRGVRSRRAGSASRWNGRGARHRAAPALVVLAHAGRGRPGQGRGLRHQERARGDPGRRRHRRDRRSRRGGLGRRAVHRRQLHRHDGVPPGRRRHRRGRALRARGARGLRRARSRDQADARRLVGPLVAQDAAARRGLVQLPAHAGPRRAQGRGPDARRSRGPQARRTRWSTSCARHMPGFENCYIVDMAPQTGVRQTRLLEGEYVDEQGRRDAAHALSPTAWRAAATTTTPTARCCRAASRTCWSPAATIRRPRRRRRSRARSRPAWRWARRPAWRPRWRSKPACRVRDVDVAAVQRTLRAQGADPGDQSGPNADVPAIALGADSRLEVAA